MFCDLSSKPRFLSDPNNPGTEKVNVTRIPDEYLDEPYERLPSTFGGPVTESYIIFMCLQTPKFIRACRRFHILLVLLLGVVTEMI